MKTKIISLLIFLLPLSAFSSPEFDIKPCAGEGLVVRIAAVDTPNRKELDRFVRSEIKAEVGKLLVGKAFSVKKFDKRTAYLVPSDEGQRKIQKLSPGAALGSLDVRVSCGCASSGSCGWYQDNKNLICQGSCSKCEMGMTTGVSHNVTSKL
jgi:hypothetical protein